MANPKGLDALEKRLMKLRGPALRKLIGSALYDAGEMIAKEAQLSITTDSASGTKGGKHQHTPSAPGEPPNNFTGGLAKGIVTIKRVEDVPGGIGVRVASTAEYAAYLEYGTSKMAARPYMRPAADKFGPTARKQVAIAVRAAGKVK